jgi:hypothetical protein
MDRVYVEMRSLRIVRHLLRQTGLSHPFAIRKMLGLATDSFFPNGRFLRLPLLRVLQL